MVAHSNGQNKIMDQVQSMLDQRYCMFYLTNVPIDSLTPQQTLQNSIDVVNAYMKQHGRHLSTWEPGMQDEAARLVNVNVIYQNLLQEPVKKPILVHREHNKLVVDCGDTRLMALNLSSNNSTVSVIITTLKETSRQYSHWKQITSDAELLNAVGLDHSTAGIYFTSAPSNADYAITWLEVGDASTAHHLHSMDKKLDMLQTYLDQQPNDFVFSVSWTKQHIDWT
jgi:hypothetical protein